MATCLSLTGCHHFPDEPKDIFNPHKSDFIDGKQRLSRDDYRHMNKAPLREGDHFPVKDGAKLSPFYEGEPKTSVGLAPPPVPAVAQILAAPRPPKIGEDQLVNIFVTEDAPIKDVLIELSRMADVDVEIDPAIQGGIIFRAQNKPFNQVIERIAQLAGLRYSMKNGVLRVERDTEFVNTYPLDFLSFTRSSSSNIDVTTSVGGGGAGGGGGMGGGGGGGGGGGMGGGGGVTGGSGSSVGYEAAGDFWEGLERAVESILAYRPGTGLSQQGSAQQTGGAGGGESFFVVNRQAGSLTLSGTQRQHEQVQDYLRHLQSTTSQQVLIEAKIIEVALNEEYHSGINWNKVFRASKGFLDVDYNNVPAVNGITQLVIGTDNLEGIAGTFNPDTGQFGPPFRQVPGPESLDAIVNLTQLFGTTRTLSSPRLHAMNNQQAVLTFATNLVYFTIQVDRDNTASTIGQRETINITSQVQSIPEGIVMTLLPSINPRTNEITLSIRPTITRMTDSVADPAVAFALAQIAATGVEVPNISNEVPVIETRELDSVMRLKSGEIMVLGGLMQQTGGNTQNGVPGLAGIPWVGNAFKSVARTERVTELFFLIKATIVGNTTSADTADETIYKKFTTDHRPLAF